MMPFYTIVFFLAVFNFNKCENYMVHLLIGPSSRPKKKMHILQILLAKSVFNLLYW